MKPLTLILRTAGTNCDAETAFAFSQAGADTESIHINRLLEQPDMLDRFQILAIPGGFSYGDDIAAGRILANQMAHHLHDALHGFVDSGRPVIGICNGFQVLIKTDLLPGQMSGRSGQICTLTNNNSGRFVDRWISLSSRSQKCIWTRDIAGVFELPVAHGEGKFVPPDDKTLKALWSGDQIALTYATASGAPANGQFPDNPNGSIDDIAGICDASGLVFGLMPHPERYIDPTQHPAWTRMKPLPNAGQGLVIFQNAVKHVEHAVGAGV